MDGSAHEHYQQIIKIDKVIKLINGNTDNY